VETFVRSYAVAKTKKDRLVTDLLSVSLLGMKAVKGILEFGIGFLERTMDDRNANKDFSREKEIIRRINIS